MDTPDFAKFLATEDKFHTKQWNANRIGFWPEMVKVLYRHLHTCSNHITILIVFKKNQWCWFLQHLLVDTSASWVPKRKWRSATPSDISYNFWFLFVTTFKANCLIDSKDFLTQTAQGIEDILSQKKIVNMAGTLDMAADSPVPVLSGTHSTYFLFYFWSWFFNLVSAVSNVRRLPVLRLKYLGFNPRSM